MFISLQMCSLPCSILETEGMRVGGVQRWWTYTRRERDRLGGIKLEKLALGLTSIPKRKSQSYKPGTPVC